MAAAAEERPRDTSATGSPPGWTAVSNAFWECDYVATVHGIATTDGAACAAITNHLKERWFAGDFEALLQWWRVNKPREHARLRDREKRLGD
jgi:hypothetical protein